MPGSISCPRCNAENRGERRYCATCGAALPRTCPHCGFSNEPDERFCGGCGAPCEAAKATGGLSSSASDAADQGERRQACILFADLCAYTALAAHRDPEETHAILGRFFEAVDRTVTRFGGTVERHIGDNVMGVFGAPLAHGDDPYRAVSAAAEIHQAIATVALQAGIPLSVRIGIAAGTVMASGTGSSVKTAYGVVGAPVNLASRLQSAAAPGTTLVSQAVREATEDLFDGLFLGALTLKGIDAPVSAWRILGQRPERTSVRTIPLIGRHAEIRLLTSLLEEVAETGRGKTIYVRGEAGIGKTRLIHTIGDLARARGYSCQTALVLDFGMGQGREVVRTLLAGLFGLAPTSPEVDRRQAADRAVESGLVEANDAVFLHDLLDVPQTLELRSLFDVMDDAARRRGRRHAALAAIRGTAARRPLLLIVEDLHWADQGTLDDVAAIANAASQCRCVLAMTSRIEGDPIDDAWRGRVRGGIAAIDLGPLHPEEASEFGERLRIANAQLLQRCIERADGNPLFLEQLLRNTEESTEADDIPASIQSLVLSRMDRLTAPDKAALQAAAVAGQRFSLEFVRSLVRDPAYLPSALLRNQMIRPEGDELLFSHALVREGVYSSLTHERRRILHKAAGEFHRGKDPVLLAEHLEQARDPETAQAYGAAAAAEAADYRYHRALALAERGRSLSETAMDLFRLDALRGDYLRELGRAQDSLDAWQAALTEARRDADRCRALIGIAAAHRILSRYEPALAALAEAEPLATWEATALERAQIHYYRGNIRFAQGDTQACLAEHRAALAAAEGVGSSEWRARASSGVGDALYSSCRMDAALKAFTDCVEICDTEGHGRVALPNRIMIGHCLIYLQRADEALQIIEEARTIAGRAGNPHAEMFATQSLLVVLVQSGRLMQASALAEPALALARKLSARRYESNILAQAAEAAYYVGVRADAVQLAESAVSISRQVGMGFTGPYALAVLALVTDDPAHRSEALAEGEAALRQGSVGHNLIWYWRIAGEVHLADRNWGAAAYCAEQLERATSGEPLPLAKFVVARLRALGRIGRGERGTEIELEVDRLIEEGTAYRNGAWLDALRAVKTEFGRAAEAGPEREAASLS